MSEKSMLPRYPFTKEGKGEGKGRRERKTALKEGRKERY
jgi:hypothetical protein